MASQPAYRGGRGFTLIELLVVVMIIAILAATALPKYFRTVERTRTTEVTNFSSAYKTAQDRYFLRDGANYATNVGDLDIEPPAFKFFALGAPAGGTQCGLTCTGAASSLIFTRNAASVPPGVPAAYQITFSQCNDGGSRFCITGGASYLATW